VYIRRLFRQKPLKASQGPLFSAEFKAERGLPQVKQARHFQEKDSRKQQAFPQ